MNFALWDFFYVEQTGRRYNKQKHKPASANVDHRCVHIPSVNTAHGINQMNHTSLSRMNAMQNSSPLGSNSTPLQSLYSLRGMERSVPPPTLHWDKV